MLHYFEILFTSLFMENMVLSFFLGMCTFLAISKQINAAFGLGCAVLLIQVITVPINNLMHFWFGEHGFGPFLKQFQQEGAK
jgi:Na+-transporting NADH:ubiquinone oxidoreductase subunit E